MNNEDNQGDSSDSEGENGALYQSDDDDELSFESDDEGNYLPNLMKKLSHAENEDDENDDVDEEEDNLDNEEADDDEEADEEESIHESDIEDISDEGDDEVEEEDSDEEPTPSSTVENNKKNIDKSIKLPKSKANNVNGTATNTKEDDQNEVGKLLRIKPSTSGNSVEAFKNELNKSGKQKEKSDEVDEYAHDTSDEEDIRNTVGNIPMHWYDEYKHIGYDWDAKKIIKPVKGDQLDDFLKRMEDPNFWRTVKDPQTGQNVILSDADIELIKRINAKKIPDASFDDYAVSNSSLF